TMLIVIQADGGKNNDYDKIDAIGPDILLLNKREGGRLMKGHNGRSAGSIQLCCRIEGCTTDTTNCKTIAKLIKFMRSMLRLQLLSLMAVNNSYVSNIADSEDCSLPTGTTRAAC
ncbi:hypothetical protein Tco_1331474, partial [Tanacetum coccineum]